MSDIDRVFARLGGGQPTTTEQRELRHIPRRSGSTSSRVVEVVRLPARGAAASAGGSRRTNLGVRAETWDDGFPTRSPPPSSPAPQLAAGTVDPMTAEPVAHVMPMWERAVAEPEVVPAPPPETAQTATTPATKRVRLAARSGSRRVADPYDTNDDGANCLRCGYLIQPARERRGLMTCAACG